MSHSVISDNDGRMPPGLILEHVQTHFAIALMKADGEVSTVERMKIQKHTAINIAIVEHILHAKELHFMSAFAHVQYGLALLQAIDTRTEQYASFTRTLLHDLEKISDIHGHTDKETRLLEYIREKVNLLDAACAAEPR